LAAAVARRGLRGRSDARPADGQRPTPEHERGTDAGEHRDHTRLAAPDDKGRRQARPQHESDREGHGHPPHEVIRDRQRHLVRGRVAWEHRLAAVDIADGLSGPGVEAGGPHVGGAAQRSEVRRSRIRGRQRERHAGDGDADQPDREQHSGRSRDVDHVSRD
jgi:hypothetical protein